MHIESMRASLDSCTYNEGCLTFIYEMVTERQHFTELYIMTCSAMFAAYLDLKYDDYRV
jgi:hypothetical protein